MNNNYRNNYCSFAIKAEIRIEKNDYELTLTGKHWHSLLSIHYEIYINIIILFALLWLICLPYSTHSWCIQYYYKSTVLANPHFCYKARTCRSVDFANPNNNIQYISVIPSPYAVFSTEHKRRILKKLFCTTTVATSVTLQKKTPQRYPYHHMGNS